MKRHGLVDELDLLHVKGEGHFYERRPQRDHMHMTCLRCGKVQEFESDLFDRVKGQVERDCHFHILVARFEIAAGTARLAVSRCPVFRKRMRLGEIELLDHSASTWGSNPDCFTLALNRLDQPGDCISSASMSTGKPNSRSVADVTGPIDAL